MQVSDRMRNQRRPNRTSTPRHDTLRDTRLASHRNTTIKLVKNTLGNGFQAMERKHGILILEIRETEEVSPALDLAFFHRTGRWGPSRVQQSQRAEEPEIRFRGWKWLEKVGQEDTKQGTAVKE